MRSKRPLVKQCKHLAKQHVDNPNEPAAPDGDSGFAEWVQIALILMHAELDKSFRETEAWFNDSLAIREELNLEASPDHTTLCRWEKEYQMRELRRLLRASAEQAGWSGEAAIDASGFQRDQTSYHYRDRANYSLQSMKTTILIDVNSLAIRDVHFTAQKAWDGHIAMQVFRRLAACSPSPDVARRGIAVVSDTTKQDAIVLILQQPPSVTATASSDRKNAPLTA